MTLFWQLSPMDFTMQAAEVFGKLLQQFPDRTSSFDCMIAAQLGVILVTNNTEDFLMYRPAGLILENWAV